MLLLHLSVEKSIEKPEWLEKQQLEEEELLGDSFILYTIIMYREIKKPCMTDEENWDMIIRFD
jgi:hypothetical protein